MPRKNIEFNVEIDPTINEIFDEGVGSSFLALRKLRWSSDSPYKLDLRKWYTKSDGEEVAAKGFSFITEEGPSNLVTALLNHGYGRTKEVLDKISDREDFLISLKEIAQEQDIKSFDKLLECIDIPENEEGSFYDPKELI